MYCGVEVVAVVSLLRQRVQWDHSASGFFLGQQATTQATRLRSTANLLAAFSPKEAI